MEMVERWQRKSVHTSYMNRTPLARKTRSCIDEVHVLSNRDGVSRIGLNSAVGENIHCDILKFLFRKIPFNARYLESQ